MKDIYAALSGTKSDDTPVLQIIIHMGGLGLLLYNLEIEVVP